MVDELSQRILYEDNHLLVVNKACGELVQGDKTGDSCLLDELKEFIRRRDAKPGNVFLGLVHRLDRPTSGAVIFAKTSKSLSRMNRMIAESKVDKRYWALVDRCPNPHEGELRHFMIKDSAKNRSKAFVQPGKGRKAAHLQYTLLAQTDSFFLLEIWLHTGRHHQIRAQFAEMGVHIRGDLKYGAKRSNPGGGISLHARSLAFIHPVSQKEVRISADPRRVQDDSLWNKLDVYNSI